MLEREGRLPDYAVACVGGGSNAIGLFHDFIDDAVGAADRRRGGGPRHRHAASTPRRLSGGRPGVLHGSYSYLLQDDGRPGDRERTASPPASTTPASGRSTPTSRPASAPATSRLPTTRRSAAFQRLCLTEGIIPALESSHAIAYVEKLAPRLRKDEIVLVCLSGRGDKDLETVSKALGDLSNK